MECLEDRVTPAGFTPGDLALLRVGGTAANGAGGSALTNSSTAIFIDEYTPTGTYVQTLALPTAASGGNNPLTLSGTATSEGELNLSTNGLFLLLTGYDTGVGTASPVNATSTTIPRTVGEISVSGAINTTTALTDFASANDARGAVSSDGTKIWLAGADSSTGGVRFINGLGGSTSTDLTGTALKNTRDVEIFNGQLYFSSDKVTSIVEALGSGTPTSGTPTLTALSGSALAPGSNSSTNAFFFARLGTGADFTVNGSDSGFNTLYIADNDTHSSGSTPGITKYTWNGTSWVSNGTVGGTADGYEGLTGVVGSNGTVTLYATKPTAFVSIVDASGYNGTFSASPTTLASSPSNTAYRGVAFAPESLPDLTVSVSGPSSAAVANSYSYTMTASNIGGVTASGVTVQFTLPSGTGLTNVQGSGGNGFSAATTTVSGHPVVTFTGASLSAGTSVSLTVSMTDNSAETVSVLLGAAVIDPSNTVSELNETNNISLNTVSTLVSSLPDLSVSATGPTTGTVGTDFNYTLTASNNGTSSASGVSVRFTLPTGLDYVTASGSNGFVVTQSGQVVTFINGSINSGAFATLTITAVAPTAATYTATAGAAVIDPNNTIVESNEANNSSTTAVNTVVTASPAPQATPDFYNTNTNTALTISATSGILANDVGSPLTIVSPLTNGTQQTSLPSNYVTSAPYTFTSPVTTTTTQGGTVTLNPDGSFNYTPPTNFSGTDSFSYTVSDAIQDYKTDLPELQTINGVPITGGAFGSAIYPKPGSTTEFYGLEDRGPNATAANGNVVEPIPGYDPAIGLFKFVNGQAILEQYIPLKAADGTPYSGRVNSLNPTGETLVDLNGNVQPQDPNGYDPEGLVVLADGSFWISDEYGPFITHFNAQGIQIGRLSPLDGSLPVELQNRTINRGMEGLTITPDGNTLVGMMQSALQEPDIGTTNSKKIDITRLITYQLVTANGVAAGTEHEYLYQLDNPGTNSTANSELTDLDATHFLVDERDGNFPGQAGTPYYKKLWEINITGATDVGPNSPLIGATEPGGVVAYDSSSTHKGLTIGGNSLEKLLGTQTTAQAFTTLTTNGITPVAKGSTPYLDFGALITTLDPTGHFFGHDKVEGVAVINGGTQIVISNDSDFNIGGVNGLGANNTAPYQLVGKTTSAGIYDDGEYLVVNLTRLPAATSTATVTISVHAPLQANNDAYTATANTTLTVPATSGILSNDTGSPLTIITPLTTGVPQTSVPSGLPVQSPQTFTPAVTATTTQGGTVTVNPDGSLSYTPPTGFTGTDTFTYTVSNALQEYKTDLPVLATFNGVSITSGGFGSSLYPDPSSVNHDEYYGVTDRGPNVGAPSGATASNVLPLPNFVPAIGLFKFTNGQAILEQYIPLAAANGTPYSGRVNSQNPTGEQLVDLNGNVLATDVNGYDPEGLVALPDGTFWISDEYGPFITHFDASGKQIGRLSPFDGTLPAELSNRTANRGLEGLTVTPDGNTLVALMQSALQQPDIGGTNSKKIDIARLVTYQLVTANGVAAGTEHEYLYQLDNPGTTSTASSEITALDATHFLVDERDGNFPGVADTPYYKKLWEINITGATDVGPNSPLIGTTKPGGVVAYDSSSTHLGLTIGGKSLEELLGTQNTAAAYTTLTTNGITPVVKGTTPYLDEGALITTLDPTGHFFSHDKIEGVAVTNNGTQIIISNDSDFGIVGATPTTNNVNGPYALQGKTTTAGTQDDGEFLVINLTDLPAATSTATVTFTVNQAPPSSLVYSTNPAIYTVGKPIIADTPSSSGGPVSSYSISPNLPAGLLFNTTTGIISGTPTTTSSATSYLITATNAGGSTSTNVSITVNAAVLLPASPLSAGNVGSSYSRTISASGGTGVFTLVVSNPINPTGLNINGSGTSSISISGIPQAAGTTSFTVLATDSAGATQTQTYTILINPAAPSSLVYSTNPATYTVGKPIIADTPSSSGGPVSSYSISPNLPAGLQFNTTTGIISGTPSATSAATSYTITATNAGGSTPTNVSITVNAANAPVSLPSSPLSAGSVGSSYSSTIAASGGSGVFTLVISNVINPTGLTITGSGTNTIKVSGIPQAAGTTSFTVLATDSAGATQTQTYTLLVNAATGYAGVVESIYTNILGRAGDLGNTQDASGWVSRLNAGTMTEPQLVSAVLHSPEALGRMVDGLYVKLLNRASDSTGRAFYVNLLVQGGTLEQAIVDLTTSPEYVKTAGTGTAYLQSLYSRLLGRTVAANSSELTTLLASLPAGNVTSAVSVMLQAPEFRTDVVNQLYGYKPAPVSSVASILPNLLQRTIPPSAAEVNGWVNSGLDLLSLETAFVMSLEFLAK